MFISIRFLLDHNVASPFSGKDSWRAFATRAVFFASVWARVTNARQLVRYGLNLESVSKSRKFPLITMLFSSVTW
jgi:hypothetical protein